MTPRHPLKGPGLVTLSWRCQERFCRERQPAMERMDGQGRARARFRFKLSSAQCRCRALGGTAGGRCCTINRFTPAGNVACFWSCMFDSHTLDSSHALQDSQTPQIAVMHCRIHKHTTFRQWCMWMEPQVCIFFCWSTVQDVVYNCCFNFGLQIYYRLLGATQPTEIMSTDQHETGLLKHTTPQLWN